MALAIYFDDLIRRGEVKSYAELARIGHVSRSRLSQIMALLDLAPSIQEAILSLSPVTAGGDPVRERRVRAMTRSLAWDEQLKIWNDADVSAPEGNP
jgi:hypothetical protein